MHTPGSGRQTESARTLQLDENLLMAEVGTVKRGGAVPASAAQRLVELKLMVDQNLISQAEYDKKKSDILNSL